MSAVWVVRNRHGDIVQTYHDEPYEQPDGWTVTRETLLTPAQAAVLEAAGAFVDAPSYVVGVALRDAVEAMREQEQT